MHHYFKTLCDCALVMIFGSIGTRHGASVVVASITCSCVVVWVSALASVSTAGCAEMLMANAVQDLAAQTPGKESIAIEAFARALRMVSGKRGAGVGWGWREGLCGVWSGGGSVIGCAGVFPLCV